MPAKKDMQNEKDAIVVKKKPRGGNSPITADGGLIVNPGDNALYTQKNMELFNLPKINILDYNEVNSRINEYFGIMQKYDCKPTVTGLSMALGIDRRRLWEIKTGNYGNVQGITTKLPEEVRGLIIKTYDFLETLWEDYMLNGKINPVSGIFLGKNHYGYQDKTEYVLTPNSQKEEYDAESIRERYLISGGSADPGEESPET